MLKRLLIIFTVLFLTAVSVTAEEENYCKDKESWKEWDALVAKYPGDTDIQALHALRLGLCVKVQRGNLTVQQATKIFESARVAIIKKKATEEVSKEKKL